MGRARIGFVPLADKQLATLLSLDTHRNLALRPDLLPLVCHSGLMSESSGCATFPLCTRGWMGRGNTQSVHAAATNQSLFVNWQSSSSVSP